MVMPRTPRPPARGPATVAVLAVTVVAALTTASRPVLRTIDNWWHWDLGRRILADGLPSTDPWGFTSPDAVWRPNQWLADLAYGVADRLGGLVGVTLLLAVVVAVCAWSVGHGVLARTPGLAGAALAAAAVVATIPYWGLRGALFSLVLLPVMLCEMLRDDGPRPTRVLALTVLWVNLHGGVFLGLAYLLVHGVASLAVGDPVAPARLRSFAAGLLGTLVTPYGPLLALDALRLARLGSASIIVEWGPPQVLAPTVLPFTFLLVLALVSVGIARGGRRDVPEVVLTVAAGVSGLLAVRNVATAAVALAVVAGPAIREAVAGLVRRPLSEEAPRPASRVDHALAAVVVVVGLALTPVVAAGRQALGEHTHLVPFELLTALAGEPRDVRLFATDYWAVPAAVVGAPSVKLFYDGRLELFAGPVTDDYETVVAGRRGWDDVLDGWCVTDLLLPDDGPAALLVAGDARWSPVDREQVTDDVAAVWYRRAPRAECVVSRP